MAVDISRLRNDARQAVLDELTKLYENSDQDGMRDFAEAIAEAAVVAVEHIVNFAETEVSSEGLK